MEIRGGADSSGYETLFTEGDVIDLLNLHDRPNPLGTLRWLVRMGRLPAIRIARGIRRFRPGDIQTFIDKAAEN